MNPKSMDNHSSEEENGRIKNPRNQHCSNHHSDSDMNEGDLSDNGGWENEQEREEAERKLDKTFRKLQRQPGSGMKGRTEYLRSYSIFFQHRRKQTTIGWSCSDCSSHIR